MLSDDQVDAIQQIRMNALVVKPLHIKRLAKLRRNIRLSDILGIGLPIVFLVSLSITEDSAARTVLNYLSAIVSGALLILSLFKYIYRWQERVEEHARLLSDNLDLVREAQGLISRAKSVGREAVDWFTQKANDVEKRDSEALAKVSVHERQEAYRKALMESIPAGANIECPVCFASPFSYTPGSCQVCGNTPQNRQTQVSIP